MASRKFIAGIRLWPPASGLASAPCSASSASASSSVRGQWYSNGAGFMDAAASRRSRSSRSSASSACRIIILATESSSRWPTAAIRPPTWRSDV